MDVHKENGAKVTDDLGQINIGDEPAYYFSYTEDNKQIGVAALLHNNVGYEFEYETLKENFDADSDIMYHLLGSVKFFE